MRNLPKTVLKSFPVMIKVIHFLVTLICIRLLKSIRRLLCNAVYDINLWRKIVILTWGFLVFIKFFVSNKPVKIRDNGAPTLGNSSPRRLLWIWVKSLRLLDVVMRTVRNILPSEQITLHIQMENSFSPRCPYLLFPAVVKTTVLLADMNDFTAVNDVYKQCKCYLFTAEPG